MYRLYKWVSAPKASGHFSIYISEGVGNSILNVFQDLAYFPRMIREEKNLWITSWLFHLSILMSVISHYKVFLRYNIILDRISPTYFNILSHILDGGAAILMIGTLILLFSRRLTSFLRKLSEPEDYLVLLLIMIIAVSGFILRYSSSINLLALRRYFASLVLMAPNNIPTNPIFLIHYTSVMILMIYFPFGKMTHIIGSALTSKLVREVKT
jgi:nitrate reductase gamma subunit